MQSKPTNWVTGFKRSPRASNVQMRDMGLFMNSSGRFETLDDSWDSIHSEGMFISGANKLYFRDEDNKDIYINSPADNQLELSASLGVIVGDTLLISDDNKIQLRNTDDTLYINSPATNQIRLEATAGVSINTTDMEGATGLNVHGTIRATGMVLESAISAIEFTIKPDSGDAMLHFEKSDASREFTVGYDDGNDLFVISDNDAFGTNDRLVIDSSGNVGIGTDDPQVKHQIYESTANTNVAQRLSVNYSTGSVYSGIEFAPSETGTVFGSVHYAHQYNRLQFSNSAAGGGFGSNVKMVIDSDGDVGIGTEVPISTLHITGGAAGGRLQSTNDTTGHTASDGFAMAMDLGLRTYFWCYEDAYMEFATNNTSNLILNSDGTLDQKSNYLVNSQTVNDLQTEQSYHFDGSDVVKLGPVWPTTADANFTMTNDTGTLSAWVYFTEYAGSVTGATILSSYWSGENTAGFIWMIRDVSGTDRISLYSPTDGWIDSTLTIPLNEWTHVATTMSNGTLVHYVNGVSDPIAGTKVWAPAVATPRIGLYASLDYADFGGEISNLRMYNRALSADEVKASYSGQAVPYADVGANQTNLNLATLLNNPGSYPYNSFSGASVTGFAVSGDGSGYEIATTTDAIVFEKGQKYMIQCTVGAITNQQPQFGAFKDQSLSALPTETSSGMTLVANSVNRIEFVPSETNTGTVCWYNYNATSAYTITDFSITRAGCVAEYLPTSIGDTTWLDTSGNALDGAVTGATQVGKNIFGGPVGIGETSPNMELTVVNANDTAHNPITGFYTNNKSVGVIVHYKGMRAADVEADGSTALDANQDFLIDAKGTGIIQLGSYANSDVKIANGDLVMGGAGKGIDFSGAGTAAEILHDYEEGTWTPVAGGSTTDGSFTYNTQTGVYTRIGNLLYCSFYIYVPFANITTYPTGTPTISGLPFSVVAGFTGGYASAMAGYNNPGTGSHTNGTRFQANAALTLTQYGGASW